jgi:hypothetical protein
VLQYIREKGIKAYRFDMFSNHWTRGCVLLCK